MPFLSEGAHVVVCTTTTTCQARPAFAPHPPWEHVWMESVVNERLRASSLIVPTLLSLSLSCVQSDREVTFYVLLECAIRKIYCSMHTTTRLVYARAEIWPRTSFLNLGGAKSGTPLYLP